MDKRKRFSDVVMRIQPQPLQSLAPDERTSIAKAIERSYDQFKGFGIEDHPNPSTPQVSRALEAAVLFRDGLALDALCAKSANK